MVVNMKKKQLNIREFQHTNGSYCILLCNAGLNQAIFRKLKEIIKHFAVGNQLFFGHYKLDGMNISRKEFLECASKIPQYFSSNGKYQKIVKSPIKKFDITCPLQELVVCQAPNNSETYEILANVFNYYLETILFCPKIDWETFVHSYSNYIDNVTKDYVLNGYADFVFSYVDSGDFSICFDPTVYNAQAIREKIEIILCGHTGDTGQGDDLREP